MTTINDLDRIESEYLRQCGYHDAGLLADCVCPTGDPRAVIATLVDEVRELRGAREAEQFERAQDI